MHTFAFKPSLADRLTIRHFRKRLPHSLRKEFDALCSEFLQLETEHVIDKVTQGHTLFACLVVCSVNKWEAHGMDRSEAIQEVQEAVLSLGRLSNAVIMRLTSVLSRDPFLSIKRHTLEQVEKAYSPSFEMTHEETADSFTSVVHKCGYRSILARHNAEDLISLFCAWDKVWIDALPRGVAFDRPTTLANGGAACRFEFRRD